jgi:hypothetical protein
MVEKYTVTLVTICNELYNNDNMKSPHLFSRFWQTMPHIAGRSMMGAGVVFSLVVAGTVITNTFSTTGINRSLAGELSPTVSGQSADSDKVAIKRQPTTQCSTDSQCGGGQMCYSGQCKSIFECKPFVDARWQAGSDDVLAQGSFTEARNKDFLSVVPVKIQNNQKEGVLRVQGGPAGEHTYERVLLKKFDEPLEVWGGSMLVNLKNMRFWFNCEDCFTNSSMAIVGGYTSESWPDTGTWTRDFVVGLTGLKRPLSYPDKRTAERTFSFSSYTHNNFIIYDSRFYIPDSLFEWPNRFVKLEWFFSQSRRLYARVDNQPWVQTIEYPPDPPENGVFYGAAIGWVSSYSGGSIDFKQVKLYDGSCLTGINSQDR